MLMANEKIFIIQFEEHFNGLYRWLLFFASARFNGHSSCCFVKLMARLILRAHEWQIISLADKTQFPSNQLKWRWFHWQARRPWHTTCAYLRALSSEAEKLKRVNFCLFMSGAYWFFCRVAMHFTGFVSSQAPPASSNKTVRRNWVFTLPESKTPNLLHLIATRLTNFFLSLRSNFLFYSLAHLQHIKSFERPPFQILIRNVRIERNHDAKITPTTTPPCQPASKKSRLTHDAMSPHPWWT